MKNTELLEAARIALKEYLGLVPEESLLVVTDENKREIALAFHEAGKELAYESFLVEMKSRKVDGEEPPEQIAEMMKSVDVVVCPTTRSITHTEARRSASKVGVRVATMPGITEETMIRCLNKEYEKVAQTTEKVANALKEGSTIRVISEIGTDITFSIKDRRVYTNTGIIRHIGASGNLPAGEVFVAPIEDSLNGTIVFDGSFGYFGLLKENVKVQVENGYAIKFTGKSDARSIQSYLKKIGEEALRIGEFGIGTNHTAIVTGNIVEDEKALGTVHFAFGNNVSMGGKINIPLHLDGIVRYPTIFVEDKIIILLGHLLI